MITKLVAVFLHYSIIIAEVDGFEWLSESNNSALAKFVNGYLPVVTIMGLILLLPFVFEFIGKSYEFRKTKSGLETSVMNRMFIYLLANIFVTGKSRLISFSQDLFYVALI